MDNLSQLKPASDHRCAGLISFLALMLYVLTLAPTVTGEDGGEFMAAAYSLGIPHPTGYPLWTLLAHLFGLLLPFGEYAWRINFMSAFWAACTIYFLVLTLRHLNVSRLASGTAALAFAASREFWEQSVIAEVYSLNAFFVIVCLYLLLRWTESKSPTTLYGFTILYSLSLSNHSTMVLFGPFFLGYIFYHHRSLFREYKPLSICLGLFLAGLLVQLYLPIRSKANPAMDWGNPETFQTFWDVFTRKQYQAMMTDERSVGLFFRQVFAFIKYYVWEFTPWVLVIALPGFRLIYTQSKAAFSLILGVFTIVLLASIIVPNFPIEYYWVWLNTTYWIPCYLITAIGLGFSLDFIEKRLKSLPGLPYALALGVILSPLLTHFDHNDQSDYYFARDYGQNVLDTMEQDAIFFGTGDHAIFPVTYLQIVEQQRPDVTLANMYGYIAPELYEEMPSEVRGTMPRLPRSQHDPIIFGWLLEHADRPIYTTRPWRSTTHRAVQYGLLYTYIPKGEGEPKQADTIWDVYAWNTLDPVDTHDDWTAEFTLYEYRIMRARYLLADDRFDEAMVLIEEAAGLVHGHKQALYNLGMLLLRNDYVEEGMRFIGQSLGEDPNYAPALYNMALYQSRQGHYEYALKFSYRLVYCYPDNSRYAALHKKILQDQSALQD